MKKFLIVFLLALSSILYAETIMNKPGVYNGEDVSGWVMSEKLDGIRGFWDGKKLLTGKRKMINCPGWFTNNFPPFKLDGELWIKREGFEMVQSVVMDEKPDKGWNNVTYNIFEVPEAEGDFLKRIEKAEKWFNSHPNSFVKIIEQRKCRNKKDLYNFLEQIVWKKGEGVIVRDPSKSYPEGNSSNILKLKKYQDMDGVVIAVNKGKGKFTGIMGSITVKIKDGKRLKIGTGFTMKVRKNPPKIGNTVVFKYYGFTRNGIPKYASFLRVRKD